MGDDRREAHDGQLTLFRITSGSQSNVRGDDVVRLVNVPGWRHRGQEREVASGRESCCNRLAKSDASLGPFSAVADDPNMLECLWRTSGIQA